MADGGFSAQQLEQKRADLSATTSRININVDNIIERLLEVGNI